MARIHLASLLLLGLLALPAAHANAPVRTGHYVVGTSAPLPADLPVVGDRTPAPIGCLEPDNPGSIFVVGCGFHAIPAGTYVFRLDDTVYGDVTFQWHLRHDDGGAACTYGEAFGSVTLTITDECPMLSYAIHTAAATAGTATLTPA